MSIAFPCPLKRLSDATVAARGIGPVDDFTWLPDGSALLAVNSANTVIRLRLGQSPKVMLTASDGLQNPTSVAVGGDRVYVSDSAYSTGQDLNLLSVRLH